MKRKIFCAALVAAAVFSLLLFLKRDAVFQRGDPVPYLLAAIRISGETPYVEVESEYPGRVFISKRGACPELFEYIEDSYGLGYAEQFGSAYLFTDGTERLSVSSEIYWGRYTVWAIPEI